MFDPPLALASLSGRSNAAWANAVVDHIGAAFLGGIAIDDRSQRAASALVDRGREEFLPDDPIEFIDDQLCRLDGMPITVGWNVRTTSVDALEMAADVCQHHDALLEINAHCRQEELCAIGCGEHLLSDTDRLCSYVQAATGQGVDTGVKVRAEIDDVDLPKLCEAIDDAGASFVHVDTMDTESVIADVAAADHSLSVIANNGVRSERTARMFFDYGADALSIGRPSTEPAAVKRISMAVDRVISNRSGSRPTSPNPS